MFSKLVSLHDRVFNLVQTKLDDWLPSFAARFLFAAVIMLYYLNSAGTKVGKGLAGFFSITDSAYIQIFPKVVEAHGYDTSKLSFIPYDAVVIMGTYAEFTLPILIVLGLFARLAALGMIGFIAVQSYVDITAHGADTETIGSWFDRVADAPILDQRALWIFLLIVLVIRGAGALSLDHVLGRMWGKH